MDYVRDDAQNDGQYRENKPRQGKPDLRPEKITSLIENFDVDVKFPTC